VRYGEQGSFKIITRFKIPCGEEACAFVLTVRIGDALNACVVELHIIKRGPGSKLLYGEAVAPHNFIEQPFNILGLSGVCKSG
jgi:hypothetical protein